MIGKQFSSSWRTGMALALAVVAAVAGLLLAIIVTARRILSNARRALVAAQAVVTNTRPIWELEQTNAVAAEMLAGARAIEQHTGQVADALETSSMQQ